MDAYDSLRQQFENMAIQAANALGFTVIFDDDDAPKKNTYVHFWYETSDKVRASAAGGRKAYKRVTGIWQFSIYVPEKDPVGDASRLADALERRLSLQPLTVPPEGHVKTDACSVQRRPVPTKAGYKAIWVSATFTYDYRDAQAAGFSA